MGKRELPEGWEWKRLGEAADINMGQSPSGTSYNENGNGTPFLQGNAEFGDTFPKHKKFTTEPSKIASKGSVLISVRAPVGDTNIADLNYCIGRGLASISLKNGDNKYLLYLLRSMKPMIEAKGTGSTFKAISKSIINEIEIPLPPLPVQRQIVAVLEQAEAVRRQRQEADALTGALLQSVFREMFGDPVRNEREWNIAKIEEICDEITVGIVVRPASYYVESGVPAFRSLNIRPDKLNLENFVYITSSDNDTVLAKSKIRDGNVLVVRTGYPGTACVVPSEFDGANCIDLIILRPKKQVVDCNYLSRFLNSEYGKAQALAGNTGLAQQHLNIGAIRQVKIPLPPLPLQQQFARVVQDVERIRERQVASGKEIEGLCEGLMVRAFGGELVA